MESQRSSHGRRSANLPRPASNPGLEPDFSIDKIGLQPKLIRGDQIPFHIIPHHQHRSIGPAKLPSTSA